MDIGGMPGAGRRLLDIDGKSGAGRRSAAGQGRRRSQDIGGMPGAVRRSAAVLGRRLITGPTGPGYFSVGRLPSLTHFSPSIKTFIFGIGYFRVFGKGTLRVVSHAFNQNIFILGIGMTSDTSRVTYCGGPVGVCTRPVVREAI